MKLKTADECLSSWPLVGKGLPLEAHVSRWHWLKSYKNSAPVPHSWNAQKQLWDGNSVPAEMAKRNVYVGPCLLPSEVANMCREAADEALWDREEAESRYGD